MRLNWWMLTGTLTISLMAAACTPAAPTSVPAAPTAVPAVPGGPAQPTAAGKPTVAAATATPLTATKVAPVRGGTMNRAVIQAWSTMDPQRDQASSDVGPITMEYLTRHVFNEQTKRYEVVPGLAASWKNTDPKTFVLQLRKGVKFHDGSDFNAEVAKWNIERMINHPKSMSKQFVGAIASVDVLSPDSIQINLKAPAASMLVNLSAQALGKPAMLSKASADAHDDDWVARNPVGTGPFQFVEWKTDDRVTVKRYDNYWGMGVDGKPLPYLDGIVMRWINEETVAVNELRTGNIHYMELQSSTYIDALQKIPEITVSNARGMNEVPTLAFNMMGGRFKDNINLRRAVLYAIDRDALAKTLGKPGDKGSCYFVAEGQLGYDPARVPCYTYDPAKSKQYLTDAGYPNGLDLTFIGVSRAMDRSQAEMLKQMLDQVNIRTTIDLAERLAWVARTKAATGWEISTVGADHNVDPDTTFAFRLVTGASGNYSGWSDPEFDKCVEQGRSSYIDTERHETYVRCLNIIYEKAPMNTLWLQKRPIAMSAKLQGMRPFWQTIDFWSEFWLQK